MAANASTTSRTFLDELYDFLEQDRDPKNTVILELILDQWQQMGNAEMAYGVAHEILQRDASHLRAREYIRKASSPDVAPAPGAWPLQVLSTASRSTSASSTSRPDSVPSQLGLRPTHSGGSTAGTTAFSDTGSVSAGGSSPRHLDPRAAMAAHRPRSGGRPGTTRASKRPIKISTAVLSDQESRVAEVQLEQQFAALQARATELEREMLVLENVGLVDNAEIFQDTRNIKEGRVSLVVTRAMPLPVRQLVRGLRGDRHTCLALVVEDFVEVAQAALEEKSTAGQARPDVVRQRLRRRQALLDAMLPPELAGLGATAMTHVEHQLVRYGKTYANDKTMLLDDVASIPTANLLVTSDNYAWDMAELADALAAGSGVMRNPMTRAMFAAEDVRQILSHPLGQRLRPMAVAQSELRHGVRAATIERMAQLSRVMLADQSAHATPTIDAIDVFLAYCHTLPAAEQQALQSLKVPAEDSHTGQAYDSAILEAVQDAKANRVCFHKVGDFLGQAAQRLASGM